MQPDAWDTWSESHKIYRIMKDVLEWECFASWEDYQRTYGAQEYALGVGVPFITPTSVAFWYYYEWRVFSPDHSQLEVFDPLHNLNAAWKIVEQFMSSSQGDAPEQKRKKTYFHQWWKNTSLWSYSGEELCTALCHMAIQSLEKEQARIEEGGEP